ncbi:glycosyltransferase [Arthrobacter sp. ISL-72]|uniref:glycosyltransferase n=1 Tax=Arthrobacter sp. ISL-72 TaxID=2819114 RepID=UPI001BE55D0F|nr:glycosyltransferase [Arthrobacter sp. ISL-72]MBT2595486.1 glycosyltransferase [Arthrobacter sp. ISL-72]
MKIFQVVTLISPDGAYGGPVRVAVNQTRALLERGHDVTLVAGATGFGRNMPTSFDGVPVRLFPVQRVLPAGGFAALASPDMRKWLTANLHTADVCHLHLARDLVMLPAALLAGRAKVPFFVQPHGMICPSSKVLARPLDSLWTRPLLRSAQRVFYLTPEEASALKTVARQTLRLEHLRNGVPSSGRSMTTDPFPREVLFLARLHPRKNPLDFVAMAVELHKLFPDVLFRLVGPDEGQGQAVKRAINDAGMGNALAWEGAIAPDAARQRMERSSLYVLPSRDEPFPMSVLEAMSLGKPVVVTESCGLAPTVRESGSGAVSNGTLRSLIDCVKELLATPSLLDAAGRHAAACARMMFGMDGVAEKLEESYGSSVRADATADNAWNS